MWIWGEGGLMLKVLLLWVVGNYLMVLGWWLNGECIGFDVLIDVLKLL